MGPEEGRIFLTTSIMPSQSSRWEIPVHQVVTIMRIFPLQIWAAVTYNTWVHWIMSFLNPSSPSFLRSLFPIPLFSPSQCAQLWSAKTLFLLEGRLFVCSNYLFSFFPRTVCSLSGRLNKTTSDRYKPAATAESLSQSFPVEPWIHLWPSAKTCDKPPHKHTHKSSLTHTLKCNLSQFPIHTHISTHIHTHRSAPVDTAMIRQLADYRQASLCKYLPDPRITDKIKHKQGIN